MAAVTIRNLPDAVHRALRLRAAENNRSTEAEMRAILEAAVRRGSGPGLGTRIADAARKAGVTDADIDALAAGRKAEAAVPVAFE